MSEKVSDSQVPATAPPVHEDPALVNTLRDHGAGLLVFNRFRLVRELGAWGGVVQRSLKIVFDGRYSSGNQPGAEVTIKQKVGLAHRKLMMQLVAVFFWLFSPIPGSHGESLQLLPSKTKIINTQNLAFDECIRASIGLCEADSVSLVQSRIKAIQKRQLKVTHPRMSIYLIHKENAGKLVYDVRTSMIFRREPSPLSDRKVLVGFVPKSSVAIINAALVRARAYQKMQGRPSSGSRNPLTKIGFFIGSGSFASSPFPETTIRIYLQFKQEEEVIEFPAYVTHFHDVARKLLVRGVYLLDESTLSKSPCEEGLRDGWSGIMFPINTSGFRF